MFEQMFGCGSDVFTQAVVITVCGPDGDPETGTLSILAVKQKTQIEK